MTSAGQPWLLIATRSRHQARASPGEAPARSSRDNPAAGHCASSSSILLHNRWKQLPRRSRVPSIVLLPADGGIDRWARLRRAIRRSTLARIRWLRHIEALARTLPLGFLFGLVP
jgi:hypothetical protein